MSRMHARLESGARALGTFVFSTDAAHSEIVGLAGYDYVVIDTEHAPLEAAHVVEHVRAAKLGGATPIVRMRGDRPEDVGRLLDTGAEGIMFPHVGLDDAATQGAFAAMRYAPDGERPTCTGVRASDYGLADFRTQSTALNESMITIGLVEDATAVDRIEEALAVTPFDVVIPGMGDLASSFDVPGQLTHELVVNATERVIRATLDAGLRAGVYVRDAAEAERWKDAGVSVFLASIDYRVLARAYQGMWAELAAVGHQNANTQNEGSSA